jgi:uncharacterized protein YueI
MTKPNVDEILQQGIHGPKEINPEERKRYLGTLRERIVVALTQSQVHEKEIYPEIETSIKEHPEALLFLNGNISYDILSKYVKLAAKHKLQHKIVTNKEYDSEIGLVLAYDHAIDKEEIYVQKKVHQSQIKEHANKKGLFSFLGKVFNK